MARKVNDHFNIHVHPINGTFMPTIFMHTNLEETQFVKLNCDADEQKFVKATAYIFLKQTKD
jgi:hypothetical protein